MKEYILIAGVDGTGKSSFRGVLGLQGFALGHIIDPVLIAKQNSITMCYIGLNTKYESIYRIANRVRKGGHDIPPDDVIRRFTHRFEALDRIVPLCDKVVFYDNDNGFVKVAEITDGTFRYTNGYRPDWIAEYYNRFISE